MPSQATQFYAPRDGCIWYFDRLLDAPSMHRCRTSEEMGALHHRGNGKGCMHCVSSGLCLHGFAHGLHDLKMPKLTRGNKKGPVRRQAP